MRPAMFFLSGFQRKAVHGCEQHKTPRSSHLQRSYQGKQIKVALCGFYESFPVKIPLQTSGMRSHIHQNPLEDWENYCCCVLILQVWVCQFHINRLCEERIRDHQVPPHQPEGWLCFRILLRRSCQCMIIYNLPLISPSSPDCGLCCYLWDAHNCNDNNKQNEF